ncbi:MAG: hypothetical protein U9N59_08690 [Campylobacterota bacterium]|nr:hypothetical protein [Campylobacterota bacterium]
MNTKKVLVSLSLAASVALFSGCQAGKEFNSMMGIPNTPQEYVAKGGDKHLAIEFSKYWESSSISRDTIKITEHHFSFDDYVKQYELEDRIAQKFDESRYIQTYKDAIAKRGNSYKVYKNPLNKELFRVAYNIKKLKTWDKYSYNTYDWTPCIIEYNSNGRIVSALTQYNEVRVAFNNFRDSGAPAKATANITIFTGYKAKSLQNKISNRMFEDNFLYESKPTINTTQNQQVKNIATPTVNNTQEVSNKERAFSDAKEALMQKLKNFQMPKL